MLESIRAKALVTVPGQHDSIMAGLNCGTPSAVAWPAVSSGFDAFVAVDDDSARAGMRALAAEGVISGETGAAGAGALLDAARRPDLRELMGLDGKARVLLLSTEGATDPHAYERIVGPLSRT